MCVVQLTSLAAVVVLVCRTEIYEGHIVRSGDISVCLLVLCCIGRWSVQSIEQPEPKDVLVITVLLLGFLYIPVGWGRVVDCRFVREATHIVVHLYSAVINVNADVVGLLHIILLPIRGTITISVGDEGRKHIVADRHLVELDLCNLVAFWFLVEVSG